MTDRQYQIAVHIKPAVLPTTVVVTVTSEFADEAQDKAIREVMLANPGHYVVGATNLGVKK